MSVKLWIQAGFAIRALRSNKLRSALTMLGIIIGVASVIIIISLGAGVQQEINAVFNTVGMNSVMIWPSGDDNYPFTMDDAESLLQINGVEMVVPSVGSYEKLSLEDVKREMYITGTTPDEIVAGNLSIEEGRFLSESDVNSGAPYAVLGQTPYKKLFSQGTSPIGEEIMIRGMSFKVVGLLKPAGTSNFLEDMDDVLYIPVSTARQRLLGLNDNSIRYVWVKCGVHEDQSRIVDDIKYLLRSRHHIQEDEEDTFTVRTMQEQMNQITQITGILTLFLSGIAGISLLVGGIGIMNIMLVSVTERTREIGVRMAIGASESDIMIQFLIEAVVLSLAGCVAGMLFGIGAGQIFAYFAGWAVPVPFSGVALSVGFASLVGIVFGFYPARRAARLNPAEALSYE